MAHVFNNLFSASFGRGKRLALLLRAWLGHLRIPALPPKLLSQPGGWK
jgi:hypothetical protein